MALACGVTNHLFLVGGHHHHHHHHRCGGCLFYSKILPPFKSRKLINRSSYPIICRSRFHSVHRSASDENSSTLPQSAPQESKSSDSETRAKFPEYNDVQKSTSPGLLTRFWEEFKLGELGLEITSIAMPAALALLADPIASLVDSAFVGHLGSVELAAVGVSVSVFNLVSKLFNVPLLNITTSFVAEEQASLTMGANESSPTVHEGKLLLPSVSTSLVLATGLGIAEAIALSIGSGFLMNTMGITADSPMRTPAEQFLSWRAFGTPPIVIALAAQGTFRGFKDTKTPLYAVGAGNLLNAILDPILIFFFHIGIGGAAVATVISEYLIALILLLKLNDKVLIMTPDIDGGRVARYLKSGALLTARTIAVLATTTVATSMAARLGPIPMAGHQICFQVWLAVSLLTDALALAGQALLASGFSQGNYGQARQVVYKVLQIGSVTGLALAVSLFLGFGALSSLFSTDSEVLEIARSGTLFVAASQPMNAFAFVIDGLYYGVSDFGYAAYSMVVIGLISVVFLIMATPSWGLAGVWAGLVLFMTLRVIAGILRMSSKSGPWKLLWSNVDQEIS